MAILDELTDIQIRMQNTSRNIGVFVKQVYVQDHVFYQPDLLSAAKKLLEMKSQFVEIEKTIEDFLEEYREENYGI